jgi:hypothetical protein
VRIVFPLDRYSWHLEKALLLSGFRRARCLFIDRDDIKKLKFCQQFIRKKPALAINPIFFAWLWSDY